MQVNLSDSEWKLMNRLWEQSPRTIMDLTASLKEDTGWSKNTVITMLSRLEARIILDELIAKLLLAAQEDRA